MGKSEKERHTEIELFQFTFTREELEFLIISVCMSHCQFKQDPLEYAKFAKLLFSLGSKEQKFTIDDVNSVKDKLAIYLKSIHPEWKNG